MDEHTRLAGQIFRHLISDAGVLPDDWIARHISRLDNVDGEVDTLSGRLAQIRTWTYVAHRPNWTGDPRHWQEITRAVEDRLSDALHEKLTQRFIDRRTSLLMRHLRDEEQLSLDVDETGAVRLGSEQLGKLDGFVFTPDPRADAIHQRTLRAAAAKMLEQEYETRARALMNAPDEAISLTHHGSLWWSGAVVAKLAAGNHPLNPSVELKADEQLRNSLRQGVKTRLENWITAWIEGRLEPLVALKRAAAARSSSWEQGGLPGPARGLAFRLAETLGHLPYEDMPLTPEVQASAKALKRFGVKPGSRAFYLPRLIKPAAASLNAMLWAIQHKMQQLPAPPNPGLTSFTPSEGDGPRGFLEAASFRVVGGRAVRLDILDRVEEELGSTARARSDADKTVAKIVSLLGSNVETALVVIRALGWKRVPVGEDGSATWQQRRQKTIRRSRTKRDSPFARLSRLVSPE
jgi:ATP-dependent RNA helicase SUPV3L1/SUV3